MLDLEAIKARVEAATPGPWEIGKYTEAMVSQGAKDNVFAAVGTTNGAVLDIGQADAEFIAHARQDVPALVAEVERLRLAIEAHHHAATDKYGSAVQDFDLRLWASVVSF